MRRERLSDRQMAEVDRLRRRRGNEYEVGQLHAWAMYGTRDVEQLRAIDEALERQGRKDASSRR
jgi:hypothetical protein